MKKNLLSFLFLFSLLISGGYIFANTSQPQKQLKAAAPSDSIDISFMQLNVWQEGTQVNNGSERIKNVVLDVKPDIVCFVEVRNYNGEDWTTKMVNALADAGVTYHRGFLSGADVSIISKYPIVSSGPLLQGAVSVFEINANEVHFYVAASHLDYTHYACYLPRGYNCGGSSPYSGWSLIDNNGNPNDVEPVTDVSVINTQNLGSKRDEQIGAFINWSKDINLPITLLGDFNEPSKLDWTMKTSAMFDHNGVVYEWTTTKTLAENDFVDAFRESFPDEVSNPGFTWPAVIAGHKSTSWAPKSDERDRIDFIFHKKDKGRTLNSAIVGPKQAYVKNVASDANTEKEVFLASSLQWPSDHKGVYTNIRIPYIKKASDDKLNINTENVPKGTSLFTDYFINNLESNDKIVILNSADSLGATPAVSKTITTESDTIEFKGLKTGNYKVYILRSNNDVVIGPKDFAVKAITENGINTVHYNFEVKTPILVQPFCQNTSGKDWVGVYESSREVDGKTNPGNSLQWAYVSDKKNDILKINNKLDPGYYKAYLFENNGYHVIAGPVYFYITDKATRIDKNRPDVNISLYPNPVSDVLSVNVKSSNSIKNITLYNYTGIEILYKQYDKQTTSQSLNIGMIPKGPYILKIETKEDVVIRKVLKK